MVRMGWVLVALAVASASTAAEAQEPLPNATELATQTAKRFPMPVRVGEMIGQDVLQPTESQPVLGRVEQVRRNGDGAVSVIVATGGLLGVGTRRVAVPIEALAFLGPQLALVGYTPAQLASLPTAPDGSGLATDASVQIGLVRPFH